MKEVGKLHKIVNGFFGEEVSDELAEDRRKECNVCPYNSKNASKGVLETIRHNMTGEFCTICLCQIFEKTKSPLEECAMGKLGFEKKWYKVKLETMGEETLNLYQVGDKLFDIRLENDIFLLDMGKVSRNKDTEFSFKLNSNKTLKLMSTSVSCGCVSVSGEEEEDGIKITGYLNVNSVSYGSGSKTVTVKYQSDGEDRFQVIRLTYFRTP